MNEVMTPTEPAPRKRWKRLLGAQVLVVLGMLVLLPVLHGYMLDGLDGWLLGAWASEQTVYAPGYSDLGFHRVRKGMTPDEVRERLGPPLRESLTPELRGEDGRERTLREWTYSTARGENSYRRRIILFQNDQVSLKVSDLLWMDEFRGNH